LFNNYEGTVAHISSQLRHTRLAG